jgi:voltage-gated potassium channel
MIFLWDFGLRFYKAESKTNYMKWGWVDLIASIPALEIFRWGRLARLVRILRIIRGVKGSKQILKWYGSHKGSSIFTFVLLTAMLLMIVSAIIILEFEKGIPESNINTPGDALWWSFVTVTTVGYGDYYPVSLAGRIAAACLMVTGMGLFSSMTVMISEKILSHQKEEKIDSELLIAEIRELRAEVQKLQTDSM